MFKDLKLIIPVALIFVLALFGIWRLYQVRIASTDTLPTPSPLSSPSGFDSIQSPSPTTTTNPPSIQPDSGSETADSKNIGIFVLTPYPNTKVTSPIKITGQANVFEGYVAIRIKDTNGNILGQGYAISCMGEERCPFEASIAFKKSQTEDGTIEAYSPSPKDGTEDYLQTIPVKFF